MYRGSSSPPESPPFDATDFPAFRRVKPLPKRRRTAASIPGTEGLTGGGLLVSEENLSATVSAIFDEHQRQRQRLQAQGILPPSPPPGSSSQTNSAGGSLSDLNAAVANAASNPDMTNQELEDILLAHADSLSTRMALQNYYMPALGGVRGFLTKAAAVAAAAAAGASSSSSSSSSTSNDGAHNRNAGVPDQEPATHPTSAPLPPPPPPMSSLADLKDLDLSLDIDLDSIEEFGARFAAAAAAAGAAIKEFNAAQERIAPNGKGRPPEGNSSNRYRSDDRDDGRDEDDEPRHRQEGQGNTKKRKVPAEGILRDRDRDRERDRESGDDEDEHGTGASEEQENQEGEGENGASSLANMRFSPHHHHPYSESSQFGYISGAHSYAPAPYPGLLAHVRKRRGKLTAAALAGVQQKEMLRRRRRQLAAFVGGLAGNADGEGMSYSWSGAGGGGGFIAGGTFSGRPGERDDIGYGMSVAFEQALMQMRMGNGKGGEDGERGAMSSFGFFASSSLVPPNPSASANSEGEGGTGTTGGGGIFSNAAGLGVDIEVESQLLFESVTGLGLPGGLGGLAGGAHSIQGGSITFDFGSISRNGEAVSSSTTTSSSATAAASSLPSSLLNAFSASGGSGLPFPFPPMMQQQQQQQQNPPSVRKSKRRSVRLARAMKMMLEMPEKKTPHPDAVAFPKQDVFEFKWPSGTADRLSATKEEVLALRRRFEAELERQKKKTKRMALVAAAAAAGGNTGAGVGPGKQLPGGAGEKEKDSNKMTKAKRDRETGVPAGNHAQTGGNKTSGSTKSAPQNVPSATANAGGGASSPASTPDQGVGQTKGKKKKKKRSTLANASNPHHLRNYVPSRLPSGGANGPAGPGASSDYWGISPLPVRFLTADIPPRKKDRAGKKGSGGARSDNNSKEKENQIPNAQQTHPPEDEWICAFCEYDLFYGGQAGYNRAVKARKKVLKRRRRARERAAGLGAGNKAKAPPAAPAPNADPAQEEEDSGDEEQSGEEDIDGVDVEHQQQDVDLRAGRWKEDG
ncbi:hypothetical protein CPC08DRAFT_724340 [Agrocybe pediades]|nr:hypothetical protein CPC08DRAFT_724340 [Agrocybe pediades]